VEYVPALEEDRFQSLVAVPLLGRRREPIGAITLHTEAPREFTDGEVDFLVSGASLVAGAIENARLFDETRQRVAELEQLTELAEAVAAAETIDALLFDVARRARELLAADDVALYVVEGTERLALRGSWPGEADVPASLGLSELGPELGRRGRRPRVAVSLVSGSELLGALVARGTRELELARAVANQASLAMERIRVLDRLTERNSIRDFFDQIGSDHAGEEVDARAARLGVDLALPHVVVRGDGVEEAFARALGTRAGLLDVRDNELRGILPVQQAAARQLVDELARLRTEARSRAILGLSSVCLGRAALGQGFREARLALLGAAVVPAPVGVLSYEDLGAYRYILRVSFEPGSRDSTIDALTRLADYDDERRASLLATLEEFLRRRGNISGTADALYIHTNTLRQRLSRIEELTGLRLSRDDWLMIEIALKIVRLRRAQRSTTVHIGDAGRVEESHVPLGAGR
jgi:GAF domain-containing protein